MKKLVRLTESDMIRLIERVITENREEEMFASHKAFNNWMDTQDRMVHDESIEISEQGQLVKGAISLAGKVIGKIAGGTAKKIPVGSTKKLAVPLIDQLPYNVKSFINLLPDSIKVGPKLSSLFGKNFTNIKTLPGRLSKYKNNGSIELYTTRMVNTMSNTKGKTINLKQLYRDANFLKKELENIKSLTPKPKQSGKAMEDWYNTLYTENRDLSNLISDLERLWKSSGSFSQTIGL